MSSSHSGPTTSNRAPPQGVIRIRGARQHNLRDVNVDIPRDAFVVVTGPSGCGKSSLAFDTLYAEGRRKYVESLSVQARQFLEKLARPDVDQIEGLPPTIAIAQHRASPNPRSTLATTSDIHDLLRLLFARVGTPHCVTCGSVITRETPSDIVDAVAAMEPGLRIQILAPVRLAAEGAAATLQEIRRGGFVRVRVNGQVRELRESDDTELAAADSIEIVIDRIVTKPDIAARLADSIETAARLSGGLVIISSQDPAQRESDSWNDRVFTTEFQCRNCRTEPLSLEPRLFSFHSPYGACAVCHGLGTAAEFDEELVVGDAALPIEKAIEPWRRRRSGGADMRPLIAEFCGRLGVAPDTPFHDLDKSTRRILMRGTSAADQKKHGFHFEGVLPNLRRRFTEASGDDERRRLTPYMSHTPCLTCGGGRLRAEALAVRIDGRNIAEACAQNIERACEWVTSLNFDTAGSEAVLIAEPVLRELRARLGFLNNVGVGYLTLDRAVGTLSGGELQRIRLASQLGGGLVGVCYVLDEPTIGLHAGDTEKLTATLRSLQHSGNSVVVVEHDPAVMRSADWIIDMGPGAGSRGGQIVAQGTPEAIMNDPASVTGPYLRTATPLKPPTKKTRRSVVNQSVINVEGARAHNLANIDVNVPLGLFCCVTGVSGSGKSTLVNEIILPALKRRIYRSGPPPGAHSGLTGGDDLVHVASVDQSPLGRSNRSNAATYTGVFDLVRDVFVKTREARVRGYGVGRFSFNIRGGRCEACRGNGSRRIEMHFLPEVFVTCQSCGGRRFNRETLEVRYRGKSIADVLDMTVDESLDFFSNMQALSSRLQALADVGLGYLHLGQPASMLSGGEAQRVRLAAELFKPGNEKTLLILDEPTTGLHFRDVERLLAVLHRICDAGHSLLVIEHNLDVIAQADWIIDMGPLGGEKGGRIVAEGPPETIAASRESLTGIYLKDRI